MDPCLQLMEQLENPIFAKLMVLLFHLILHVPSYYFRLFCLIFSGI
uniref:Uncharacterized protein n=1 Tax=Rhizophora mucronata TaxID=61149 RepID=A0A2P2N5E6_RHIMU